MYLIPRNISNRFEFFPNWGLKELIILLIAFGTGVLLTCLLGLVTRSPFRFLLVFVFSVLGYLVTQPVMADGSSALEILAHMRNYRRKQKLYLYGKEGF